MKRSELARRTPLARGSSQLRRAPIKRVAAVRSRTAAGKPRRPRDTGPNRRQRALVHKRSGRQCEFRACLERAVHVHHRRPRGAGGDPRPETNQPSNLVDLCLDHHLWVESNRVEAALLGLLVDWGADPAARPVVTRHHPGPVLLDDEGGWRAA